MDDLTVHAYDWQVLDEYDDNNHCVINAWCLDRESKPYLLRFHDFPAFCNVELPYFIRNRRVKWNKWKAQQVFEKIKYVMGRNAPYKFFLKFSKKLYCYRQERQYPMMVMMFDTIKAMYKCKSLLSKPLKVKNLGSIACKVWETKISLPRKLLTLRNTKYCQWFNIKGRKIVGEEKISTLDNEYIVDRWTMNAIPPDKTKSWMTYPRILEFDIECYSSNCNAFPNKYLSKDAAFAISCVYQRAGHKETRVKDAIIYGDVDAEKIENADNIIKVKSEMELIDKFCELIVKYDPEIVSGYNIFGFDYPYLDARMQRRMRDWKCIGRLIGEKTSMTSFSWGSSGYGHNDINILEMPGRISLDMLPIIKRDYKLPLYRLDYVSKYFLGRGKHDVEPKEMFMAFEQQQDAWKTLVEKLTQNAWKKSELTFDKIDVEQISQWIDKSKLPDLNKDDLKSHLNIYLKARDEMSRVMAYCMEDSIICIDLFDKINCWIGLIELSNVVGVTPVELFTRGQQLRVLSQVFDVSYKQNIVIDERIIPRMKFSGGFVYEPIPGIYKNIPCLDFKSLYPTVMIAYNICYTTFVPIELMDKIPDEKCHVFEWDEEIEDEDNKTKTKTKSYKFKFVKQPIGLLPKLLKSLISERDRVRGILKGESDPVVKTVLNRRQLALKVSTNSIYGILGVQMGGKLPLPEAAACITAKSREAIKKVNSYLETKNKRIVYGDTDSSMPDLGITQPKTAYAECEKWAGELSKLFPPPMLVEVDWVAHTILNICKKKYAYIKMKPNGEPDLDPNKIQSKGIALARRDNCKWQRKVMRNVLWKILTGKSMMDTHNYIIGECEKIITHQIKWSDLVMIKGLGSNYKNKNYFMKIFSDELLKIGKPANPGERLEYLIVRSNQKQLLGYKMRLPSTYLERSQSEQPEHIDYIYYIEKILKNCIEQLFKVGYKDELNTLHNKYLNNDQDKLLDDLKKTGYEIVVQHLLDKNKQNKDKTIQDLLDTDLSKHVKKLITLHIKKKKQYHYRITREPIKMFLKHLTTKQNMHLELLQKSQLTQNRWTKEHINKLKHK